MAGQGFPNEGKDHRLLGWLAPLARRLTRKSMLQPPSFIISGLSVKIYLPLWWVKRKDFDNYVVHTYTPLLIAARGQMSAKGMRLSISKRVTQLPVKS